jgi:hypothetical protein
LQSLVSLEREDRAKEHRPAGARYEMAGVAAIHLPLVRQVRRIHLQAEMAVHFMNSDGVE